MADETTEEEVDDRELVARAQKGDAAAFDEFFQRYYMMVYRLAFRLTSRQEDAEEVAQEAMTKAARNLNSFRGDSSVKTWLWKIAVHASYDHMRKRKRHQNRVEALKADEDAKAAQVTHQPHEKGGMSDEVLKALESLPRKQREAIVLTIYEDMDHKEAAKVLGCSTNTVSWRVFSAKGKLKKLLKGAES